MKNLFLLSVLILSVIYFPADSSAWECEVTVDGPATIKLGQKITLSSSGIPTGGSYAWSRTPNLIPQGSTATLTGFKPTFSEYIKVLGYYRTPKGSSCSDTIWIWACICSVNSIEGPEEAKIGEEVTLNTLANPIGGAFTWTINSGTGSITANGSSAVFVSDQAGFVEIKVSYIPPDGGEPCVQYHMIEVQETCAVTLTAEMSQRPVCRPVDFYALGIPAGGSCTWRANGISGTGCDAIYNGQDAGNDTVTVTYTTPEGSTCDDSKNILSYALVDNMEPIPSCFSSGDTLHLDDFLITTTPAGYQDRATLSPITVTAFTEQVKNVEVTAALVCTDNFDETSTIIQVINNNIKESFNVNFSIPDDIKKPLQRLGLADTIDFSTTNSYSAAMECCGDNIATNKSGTTDFILELPPLPIPIAGIPLPSKLERWAKANITLNLTGRTKASLKGDYNGCTEKLLFSGEGSAEIVAALNGGVKANVPGVIVAGGEVEGSTGIVETMKVIDRTKLQLSTTWSGLTGTVNGLIRVKRLGFDFSFAKSKSYFEADALLPIEIQLPTLGDD